MGKINPKQKILLSLSVVFSTVLGISLFLVLLYTQLEQASPIKQGMNIVIESFEAAFQKIQQSKLYAQSPTIQRYKDIKQAQKHQQNTGYENNVYEDVQKNIQKEILHQTNLYIPSKSATVKNKQTQESRVKGPYFKMYIVLDDAGENVAEVEKFYDFPEYQNLTVAVLPHLPATQGVVSSLQRHSVAYILHMPMEALGPNNPGKHALLVGDSKQQWLRNIQMNIDDVKGIIGINNHMGSRATSDRRLMVTLLSEINKRNLFFMDSYTASTSIVSNVAASLHTPLLIRDVFLDNKRDVEYIKKQIEHAFNIARTKGYVVAIGHVTKPETAQALVESYEGIIERGGKFVSLRDYTF